MSTPVNPFPTSISHFPWCTSQFQSISPLTLSLSTSHNTLIWLRSFPTLLASTQIPLLSLSARLFPLRFAFQEQLDSSLTSPLYSPAQQPMHRMTISLVSWVHSKTNLSVNSCHFQSSHWSSRPYLTYPPGIASLTRTNPKMSSLLCFQAIFSLKSTKLLDLPPFRYWTQLNSWSAQCKSPLRCSFLMPTRSSSCGSFYHCSTTLWW